MRRLLTAPLLATSLLVGCVTTGRDERLRTSASDTVATVAPSRTQAVALAEGLLGKSSVRLNGRHYPDDCTGLVRAIFESMGVGLFAEARRGDNGVTSIFRFAEEHGRVFRGGRPLPGDLVFFKDTYDQNRNGRYDDGLTHVGLVEKVDDEGTVTIIHRVRKGIVRFRMNLDRRDERVDGRSGKPLNDFLRAAGPGQKSVLTAQLFEAYASVLPTHADELPMPGLPVLRPQPEGGSI